ncbi:RNase H family protein [Euphorbia peplus]|nr:RNase H family protein [Euphorbia peplus]
MDEQDRDKDAFYVVRKGDFVGIYKTLRDCQAQLGSSVTSPSVSVFKGYGLSKDTEEFLNSHGLKNALYSIHIGDVQNDLFGQLVPCPFQQPASSGGNSVQKHYPPKSSLERIGSMEVIASSSNLTDSRKKFLISDDIVKTQAVSSCSSCILEFDGASKGNPGPAGAGAVLRAEDGSMVFRLREGLGTATNNVAEYRALILGLKHALRKGYKHIRVRGDSNLVCMQIQGLWKINNQNLAILCKDAKELKDQFASFQIEHVLREFNSDADVQANLAVNLRVGQIEEECKRK